MATVLYTAQTELRVSSVIASWPCAAGQTLPLNPAHASTQQLLANGSIELAGPGAVDTCTPPGVVRGMPGLKAPGTVSN